jgi:hypothetical protein
MPDIITQKARYKQYVILHILNQGNYAIMFTLHEEFYTEIWFRPKKTGIVEASGKDLGKIWFGMDGWHTTVLIIESLVQEIRPEIIKSIIFGDVYSTRWDFDKLCINKTYTIWNGRKVMLFLCPYLLGSALFWHIMQSSDVVLYRRFGTTYRSYLQGSRSIGLLDPWRFISRDQRAAEIHIIVN